MKNLVVLCFLMVGLASCSLFEEKVNDAKIEVAEKLGSGLEDNLKSQYVGDQFEGLDCESEAERLGDDLEEKVLNVLKAKQKQKSIVSDSLRGLCMFASSEILPAYILESSSSNKCLLRLGADKASSFTRELCEQI